MAPEPLKYYEVDQFGQTVGIQLDERDALARGLDPADGLPIGEDGRPVRPKTARKATAAKTPPVNKATDADATKAQSAQGLTPGA